MNRAFLLLCMVPLATAAAADVNVVQKDKQFTPAQVTVKTGDRLVIHNADEFAHHLFSRSPGAFFGPYMEDAQQTISVVVKAQNDFEVSCLLHPKMKLLVKIGK